MKSPISVVPKGEVYCPKYRQEQDMQICANCPHFGGHETMQGYGAATCHSFKCLFKD